MHNLELSKKNPTGQVQQHSTDQKPRVTIRAKMHSGPGEASEEDSPLKAVSVDQHPSKNHFLSERGKNRQNNKRVPSDSG
jgi:hypothetical protein